MILKSFFLMTVFLIFFPYGAEGSIFQSYRKENGGATGPNYPHYKEFLRASVPFTKNESLLLAMNRSRITESVAENLTVKDLIEDLIKGYSEAYNEKNIDCLVSYWRGKTNKRRDVLNHTLGSRESTQLTMSIASSFVPPERETVETVTVELEWQEEWTVKGTGRIARYHTKKPIPFTFVYIEGVWLFEDPYRIALMDATD